MRGETTRAVCSFCGAFEGRVHLGHAAHVELVPERGHGGGAVPGVVVGAGDWIFDQVEIRQTDLFQDLLAVSLSADVYCVQMDDNFYFVFGQISNTGKMLVLQCLA